ncbi:MAG TPA: hypothetical protein GX706_02990 [Candidatus Moranbacteria bacterium]|nr:hypothetical protein [Candidatus Moranbacteria bacterium]
MELKEYLKIIKKDKSIFLVTWVLFIVIVELVLVFWPQSYQVTFPIGLSRTSQIQKNDSTANQNEYDYFYQMEASNLFSKEIVQWLKNSGTLKLIFDNLNELSDATQARVKKTLVAEQLSPGFIKVEFSVDEPIEVNLIVSEIKEVISERVASLAPGKDDFWFKLVFGETVIEEKKVPFWPANIFAVLFGFWTAVLIVLLRHYWHE